MERSALADITTQPELAELLRWLRRRDARRSGRSELTYRELAARTGWSHAVIGEYFTGRALPPTDRFDELVRWLGASPAEAGVLGTVRDRVDEQRRAGRPAPRATGSSTGRPVPEQLPADVAGFTGRADHVAALNRLLEADGTGSVVVICAVSGTAGIGKTTLAVHWAHQVRDRFPDGQLFVNLRGFDPAGSVMDPEEAMRGFLDALEVAPHRIPLGLDAQAALYRSLVAGRRMLIVADNARDAEQVRPLLPGAPGCLVIVTSRKQLPGLVAGSAAQPVTLDLLTPLEGRELLGHRLGNARVEAEPQATREIVARCAQLPLALTVLAARAASHPQFPLAALAAELRDARAKLDVLSSDDATTDVRAVFSWSYHALGGEAARLFRLLGLHPGPDISAPAAASLCGLRVDEVRRLLTGLARVHLLTEHTPGRYGFHDLLRAYASELCRATDSSAERDAAQRRTYDHYLHSANAADLLLHPHRDPVALLAPSTDISAEEPQGQNQALAWLTAEHTVLLAVLDQASDDARFDTHTWQLAWSLTTYHRRQGLWHDWCTTQNIALASAQRLNDQLGQATAHRCLGWAYTDMGRFDEAGLHLHRALQLFQNLGDEIGMARTHLTRSRLAEREGRLQDSLGHNRVALDLFTAAGQRIGQAQAWNNIGWTLAQTGDYTAALEPCRKALALQQELGDGDGQAHSWDSLGFVQHKLGRHDRAIDCYQHAIRLFRDIGDRYYEAEVLTRLGDIHHTDGSAEPARASWAQALVILADLDHPDTDRLRERIRRLDRNES
ncbi:BTAD domain-containing putative transcriptional regulator [Microlunatus ginsengisoli]|uniref:BTAD domain-containing putative transcriptional regulator n=1 Tax=Microlunatus ginsengisoli TaxID=363863 RepID=A0ABP6ZFJ6_9ACTN